MILRLERKFLLESFYKLHSDNKYKPKFMPANILVNLYFIRSHKKKVFRIIMDKFAISYEYAKQEYEIWSR